MPTEDFVSYPDRVARDIRAQIAAGQLKPGGRLPSIRDLARHYGYAPGTIQRAIKQLIKDGVLRAHQGDAVYVADPARPGGGVDGPSPPGAS